MLNLEQSKAVQSEEDTTIVIAGPGTGKTHTLVERILYLLRMKAVSPKNILALTFTHKAAEEVITRIQNIREGNTAPVVKTIHAWCYLLLNTELSNPPELITEQEATALRQTLTDEKHYAAYLKENNCIDFDGLLTAAYELLTSDTQIRTKYQRQYGHILIDEYQDLNQLQQELLLLLAEKAALFVIGDPNQAIYEFRGANTEGFTDLQKHRPNPFIITLSENYRSSQHILDVAYCLFPLEQKQHAHRTTTGKVYTATAATENAESLVITRIIQQLVGGVTRQDHDTGRVQSYAEGEYTFGDIAILIRNRFQGNALRKSLIMAGLPFAYIDREESTNEALEGALKHIAQTDSTRLPFNASLHEYVVQIFTQHGVTKDDSAVYLKEARQLTTHRIERDSRIFNELAKLMRTDPTITLAAEKINVLTVHASKGLEWPVVFIPGLEDGVFPHIHSDATPRLEEERRLFFVAMTRAKDRLYLTHAKKRMVYGETVTSPSRFLNEIPDPYLEKLEELEKKKIHTKSQQKKLF